jgi:hypothetical protein
MLIRMLYKCYRGESVNNSSLRPMYCIVVSAMMVPYLGVTIAMMNLIFIRATLAAQYAVGSERTTCLELFLVHSRGDKNF